MPMRTRGGTVTRGSYGTSVPLAGEVTVVRALVVEPGAAVERHGHAALGSNRVVGLAAVPVHVEAAHGHAVRGAQPERLAVGPVPVAVGGGLVAAEPQGVAVPHGGREDGGHRHPGVLGRVVDADEP